MEHRVEALLFKETAGLFLDIFLGSNGQKKKKVPSKGGIFIVWQSNMQAYPPLNLKIRESNLVKVRLRSFKKNAPLQM